MKNITVILSLLLLFSCSNSLPHFTYDGIESFHEEDKISFTIYGSLSEEINPEKMSIKNYLIEDMGEFQCSLQKNEATDNKKRTHKIVCTIKGTYERRGYILEEPEVVGFDFKNEKGETTWPKEAERKTFLIGELGEKIELDNEPILRGAVDYVNPLLSVRKSTVDKALASLPARSRTTKVKMIEAMKTAKKTYSLSEAETAYMVYKWESQNIVYDCYNFNHDRNKIDYSEDGTYNAGKGVCDGYAKIFLAMCTSLGLEAARVVGYSKSGDFYPGYMPSRADHAWNAVKIGGNYYVLDVTWGSGSCNGDSYVKSLKDSYFCSNPDAFIRTHLPVEQKWQLVSPTITLEQFVNLLNIGMDFYENGFKTVTPDAISFTSTQKFTVEFTHDSETRKTFLYHLYLLQSNTFVEQPNSCWIDRQDESSTMTCFTNKKGTYKLQIFGGPSGLQSYPMLLEYDIESTKTASTPLGFPSTYGAFSNSDLQIIEPLYNPLTRGQLIDVKFRTTTFDNLYILNDNHLRELDSNGNGEFTASGVYIFAEEVYLVTEQSGGYAYLAQYTTVPDPNSSTEPTFPDAFGAPKNVLYSPLTDTLIIGKTYEFKIECESATKIAVLEGSNFSYLTKNGSMFTGSVKINGKASTISIVSISNGYYYTYYRYRTSR